MLPSPTWHKKVNKQWWFYKLQIKLVASQLAANILKLCLLENELLKFRKIKYGNTEKKYGLSEFYRIEIEQGNT